MDFSLTEEHKMFRATLREFVDREIRPVAREWEKDGTYPTPIVETMKKMGLFGLTVPEEYGGMDVDLVSLALVFEELSRGWMGIAGILGSPLAVVPHDRQPWNRRPETTFPSRAGHWGAPHRRRSHRTERRFRSPGHPDKSNARGRRVRDPGHKNLDHKCPPCEPTTGSGQDQPRS